MGTHSTMKLGYIATGAVNFTEDIRAGDIIGRRTEPKTLFFKSKDQSKPEPYYRFGRVTNSRIELLQVITSRSSPVTECGIYLNKKQ